MGKLLRHLAPLLLAAGICSTGCVADDGMVHVDVCGDVKIPDDVTAARVSILNSQRKEVRSTVLELAKCPGPDVTDLPQTVDF